MPSANITPTHSHQTQLRTMNASEAAKEVRAGTFRLSERGKEWMSKKGHDFPSKATASNVSTAQSTNGAPQGQSTTVPSNVSTIKPGKEQ